MSDDELRAVELDENTERLDLADYEASKAKLAEIRQAEAAAKAEANTVAARDGIRGRGQPKKVGSERDVAARTGISRPARERIARA